MVYVIVASGAIICALINWFLKDQLIIAGTSITGSYFIVSGIGVFAGGFPSIYDMYELTKKGIYNVFFIKLPKKKLDWKIYCYMGGILVLTIIGIIVQCVFHTKHEDKDEDDDEMNEKFMAYKSGV